MAREFLNVLPVPPCWIINSVLWPRGEVRSPPIQDQGGRTDRVFGPYKKGPRSFCRSTAAKSVRGLGLVSRFYHPRNPRFKTKNARFDILWKERVFVPSPDVGSVSSSRN